MKKSERTRQSIIEKTSVLFNTKGFEATTLQDLTVCTGLTKGALYGNFKDKEEIATEAFKYAVQKSRQALREEMEKHYSVKKKVFAFLDFYARFVFAPPVSGGCPVLNAAVEVDDYRTHMRKVVAKEASEILNSLTQLLDEGIALGEFKKDLKSKEVATVLFCTIEGALMMARLERSDEAMKIVVQNGKAIINQYINK
jgi:TetR/AcrR family transcriptional repressor of nem operon